MESFPPSAGLLEQEPTASQEALRLIVEVFREGQEAASDLRRTAFRLTPGQLRVELQSIEHMMLSQISSICDNYQLQELPLARN